MYNLLSDKLDKFEREVRKLRNQVFGRITTWVVRLAGWTLRKSRAYIHTDILKSFREYILGMSNEVESELELRRKINVNNASIDQVVRDSTVLTSEQIKDISGKPQIRASKLPQRVMP